MKKLQGIATLATALMVCTPLLSARGTAHDTRTVRHVLDRITFGARPGDVQAVMKIGLKRFIDEQLHPDRLDDTALTERMRGFETLGLSSREIARRYEVPVEEARR